LDLTNLHKKFLESTGVSTDTRNIIPGSIFFALKGANFNGNEFASEAIKKGAVLAVIDEPEFHSENNSIVLCDDVLITLQNLATYHRRFLDIPIVSLTGSNGKTTTKELIHAVLKTTYNCYATQGNYNNHIGVPLTLLGMNSETEIGIVEMGANHQGEIKALAEIAEPNFGYITNFGKAHLEGFGGVEGVIKGKTELYRNIIANKATLFVNGDDPKQLFHSEKANRILFNGENSNYQIKLIQETPTVVVEFENKQIETQLIGKYNFSNIAAAITIGKHFNVSTTNIATALSAYVPEMNRSQLVKKKSNTIILDAYNANPNSMIAALENFDNLDAKNKMVILGDMFELGKDAAKEHQAIVNYLEDKTNWKKHLVGENFYATTSKSVDINKYNSFDSFKEANVLSSVSSYHILIKGSRGMALERCIKLL